MACLDNQIKSLDITIPAKVHIRKAMVFPGVMYGCESWTMRKAVHRKLDIFESFYCYSSYIVHNNLQGS